MYISHSIACGLQSGTMRSNESESAKSECKCQCKTTKVAAVFSSKSTHGSIGPVCDENVGMRFGQRRIAVAQSCLQMQKVPTSADRVTCLDVNSSHWSLFEMLAC